MMPTESHPGVTPSLTHPLIGVVDDDPSFLRSLGRLLRTAGYGVEMFGSARAFLRAIQEAVRCHPRDFMS